MRVKFNWENILAYRELKSKQLKRPLSFSEALALWFTENLSGTTPKKKSKKNKESVVFDVQVFH